MSDLAAPLIFFDRSRIVTDWRCPRSRFWGYEYKGRGVTPLRRAIYFDFGSAIHESLDRILRGDDVETVTREMRTSLGEALKGQDDETLVAETLALAEGLVWGWVRWGLSALRAEYDIVATEAEVTLTLAAGVTMACKPDLILRRRSDHTHWYVEWKTTGSLGEKWFPQWNRAIQLQAGALAVKETLGIEIDGVIVQGLYKGYQKEGRSTSIFVYGYQKGLMALYKWAPGAVRVPTWELQGGVKGWVGAMPPEVLEAQFAQTPPIFLRKELLSAWMAQTLYRERVIAGSRTTPLVNDPLMLDMVFPQHFDQCEPQMGAPCAFTRLCFNPLAQEDPLRFGFTWREPHHKGDPALLLGESGG